MIRCREARRRAGQVLTMAGQREVPVDVESIAAFLGFGVLLYEFPDTTSGLIFIEDDIKTIGVNSNHAPTRRRFTIAHEIGHYLMGHESYDNGATYVDDRPGFMDSQNRQETEANEFAAELLMPAEWLRRDVAEYGLDAAILARRYNVSEQAMWIQLIDLRLARDYS